MKKQTSKPCSDCGAQPAAEEVFSAITLTAQNEHGEATGEVKKSLCGACLSKFIEALERATC